MLARGNLGHELKAGSLKQLMKDVWPALPGGMIRTLNVMGAHQNRSFDE